MEDVCRGRHVQGVREICTEELEGDASVFFVIFDGLSKLLERSVDAESLRKETTYDLGARPRDLNVESLDDQLGSRVIVSSPPRTDSGDEHRQPFHDGHRHVIRIEGFRCAEDELDGSEPRVGAGFEGLSCGVLRALVAEPAERVIVCHVEQNHESSVERLVRGIRDRFVRILKRRFNSIQELHHIVRPEPVFPAEKHLELVV